MKFRFLMWQAALAISKIEEAEAKLAEAQAQVLEAKAGVISAKRVANEVAALAAEERYYGPESR